MMKCVTPFTVTNEIRKPGAAETVAFVAPQNLDSSALSTADKPSFSDARANNICQFERQFARAGCMGTLCTQRTVLSFNF